MKSFLLLFLLLFLIFLAFQSKCKEKEKFATDTLYTRHHSQIELEKIAPLEEKPRVCPDGNPPTLIHYQTRGCDGNRYVSNYEVAPGRYLFGVRNLARHWRKSAGLPDLMENWFMDAARCEPPDTNVHQIWLDPVREEMALFDELTPGPPKQVFYVLQMPEDDSLGHLLWTFAIHLLNWKALISAYPNLQLMVRKGAMYSFKKNLFRLFGIPDHRVVWRDISAYDDAPFGNFGEDNLFFFPPNTSNIGKSTLEAIQLFEEFRSFVLSASGLPQRESCSSNPTGLILVPKMSLRLAAADILEVFSESIRQKVLSLGGVILNTSTFLSIEEQVNVFGRIRVVVIPYGSGLDFNGQFMRGATIIATNYKGQPYHYWPTINELIWAPIIKYNRVFFSNNETEIIDLIVRAVKAPPLPCPLPVSARRRKYPLPLLVDGKVVLPPLEAYEDQDP
jgi:hypothetical protein